MLPRSKLRKSLLDLSLSLVVYFGFIGGAYDEYP